MGYELGKKKSPLYGWYSKKQEKISKRKLCYLNTKGEEIWVTEVSHNIDSPTGFDDRIFLGEVTSRVFKSKEEKEEYSAAVKKFIKGVKEMCDTVRE